MEHMLYCSLIRISESLSMDGMGTGVGRSKNKVAQNQLKHISP